MVCDAVPLLLGWCGDPRGAVARAHPSASRLAASRWDHGAGPAALLCCVRVRGGAPPISLASAVKKFQTVVPCGRLCAQRPTSTHTGGRFLPSTTGVGSRGRANLRCAARAERSGADRRGPQCTRTCCGGAQLRPACAAVLPDANARTFHRQRVGATCAAVACCTTGGRRNACDAERCMTGVCRTQAAHHQQPVGANCCECVGESALHNAVVAHHTPPWVRA